MKVTAKKVKKVKVKTNKEKDCKVLAGKLSAVGHLEKVRKVIFREDKSNTQPS